jgi:hypothetical protein
MNDIVDHLHGLGFRASREQIHSLLAQLTASHASPQQALEGVVSLERRERDVRNLATRAKRAALGATRPAADYDWSYPKRADQDAYEDLLTLGFVARHQNVLFRGPPGTGKTMLAKTLGLCALQAGKTVVYTNLSAALADLLRQESLPAVERRAAAIHLGRSPDLRRARLSTHRRSRRRPDLPNHQPAPRAGLDDHHDELTLQGLVERLPRRRLPGPSRRPLHREPCRLRHPPRFLPAANQTDDPVHQPGKKPSKA